jgi:hypothetical protein
MLATNRYVKIATIVLSLNLFLMAVLISRKSERL